LKRTSVAGPRSEEGEGEEGDEEEEGLEEETDVVEAAEESEKRGMQGLFTLPPLNRALVALYV
jgi:hypothetical protein